ncbi:hypothetical protein YC2023_058791 [Brassica napus]
MSRLSKHFAALGHIYPQSLTCYDIMPPTPKVLLALSLSSPFWAFLILLSSSRHCASTVLESNRREKNSCFNSTGLSIAPRISFSDVTAANIFESKESFLPIIRSSFMSLRTIRPTRFTNGIKGTSTYTLTSKLLSCKSIQRSITITAFSVDFKTVFDSLNEEPLRHHCFVGF